MSCTLGISNLSLCDYCCNDGRVDYVRTAEPQPSKSWLIVKEQYSQYAAEVFAGTGIQITTEGQRHLGAVIGSPTFKDKYVTEKIDGWIDELKVLEKIAKVEPHVAAYIFGFQHKYTYML